MKVFFKILLVFFITVIWIAVLSKNKDIREIFVGESHEMPEWLRIKHKQIKFVM